MTDPVTACRSLQQGRKNAREMSLQVLGREGCLFISDVVLPRLYKDIESWPLRSILVLYHSFRVRSDSPHVFNTS
jgi:hypothetical protein